MDYEYYRSIPHKQLVPHEFSSFYYQLDATHYPLTPLPSTLSFPLFPQWATITNLPPTIWAKSYNGSG